MKRSLPLLVASFALLLVSATAFSATAPLATPGAPTLYARLLSLKVKDVQRITGHKLSLKEKIGFGIMKHRLKKSGEGSSKGQSALLFGIAALALLVAGLFIPYVILGSVVCSIVAIVLGTVAKKQDPDDRKAAAGKLLGWLTLGVTLVLFTLAALVIASIFD